MEAEDKSEEKIAVETEPEKPKKPKTRETKRPKL